MKVIVAGSREITDYKTVKKAILESDFNITEIVSGGARGVDSLGEYFARQFKLNVKQFIPDWNRVGKSAGFRRNEDMANYADALIAVWDGKSRGTAHMIECMKLIGKKTFVKIIKLKK